LLERAKQASAQARASATLDGGGGARRLFVCLAPRGKLDLLCVSFTTNTRPSPDQTFTGPNPAMAAAAAGGGGGGGGFAPLGGAGAATLLGAAAAASGGWTEHRAPDGRPYWHNVRTRESRWRKPPELMTPEERAAAGMALQPPPQQQQQQQQQLPLPPPPPLPPAQQRPAWTEHRAPDGRTYWHNVAAKKSVWKMPEELKAAAAAAAAGATGGAAAATPSDAAARPAASAAAAAAAAAAAPTHHHHQGAPLHSRAAVAAACDALEAMVADNADLGAAADAACDALAALPHEALALAPDAGGDRGGSDGRGDGRGGDRGGSGGGGGGGGRAGGSRPALPPPPPQPAAAAAAAAKSATAAAATPTPPPPDNPFGESASEPHIRVLCAMAAARYARESRWEVAGAGAGPDGGPARRDAAVERGVRRLWAAAAARARDGRAHRVDALVRALRDPRSVRELGGSYRKAEDLLARPPKDGGPAGGGGGALAAAAATAQAAAPLAPHERLAAWRRAAQEHAALRRAAAEAERAARGAAERQARRDFRALLERERDAGRLLPTDRWRDWAARRGASGDKGGGGDRGGGGDKGGTPLALADEEAYRRAAANEDGSRPKELFLDALEPLDRAYRAEHRPRLMRALALSGSAAWAHAAAAADEAPAVAAAAAALALAAAAPAAAPDRSAPLPPPLTAEDEALAAASWGDFSAALVLGSPAAAGLPEPSRRAAFEEACGRPRDLAAVRSGRARADFARFLRRARGLYADTPWEEFEAAFRGEPEFRAVGAAAAEAMLCERTALLARRALGDAAPSSGGGGGSGDERRRGPVPARRHPEPRRKAHQGEDEVQRRRRRDGGSEAGGDVARRSASPAAKRARTGRRGPSVESAEEGELA